MDAGGEVQFQTLESAHDFVALLAETVAEAKHELEGDVDRESADTRRRDALRIALYNLVKLELHVNRSSRILNDFRTLRRLLFEESTHSDKTSEPNPHSLAADRIAHIPMRSMSLKTPSNKLSWPPQDSTSRGPYFQEDERPRRGEHVV